MTPWVSMVLMVALANHHVTIKEVMVGVSVTTIIWMAVIGFYLIFIEEA
jgi:hypothetical protein